MPPPAARAPSGAAARDREALTRLPGLPCASFFGPTDPATLPRPIPGLRESVRCMKRLEGGAFGAADPGDNPLWAVWPPPGG